MNYPIINNHFSSLFRFTTPGKTSILYNYLLLNGVYVWEGRNCFLSPAHSEEILEDLFLIIKKSCEQMEQDGFLIPKKKK
jgi:glutamate-1-semialdehyde aminotransferase